MSTTLQLYNKVSKRVNDTILSCRIYDVYIKCVACCDETSILRHGIAIASFNKILNNSFSFPYL